MATTLSPDARYVLAQVVRQGGAMGCFLEDSDSYVEAIWELRSQKLITARRGSYLVEDDEIDGYFVNVTERGRKSYEKGRRLGVYASWPLLA